MNDLRQAAQQALDYWEQVAWGDAVMADKMDALRAALAQQAEPVSADAAYQRWLADTHAPALRRMDSQGAFAAGWQAALAQQAEPERHFCEHCGKRLSQDGIHTCTPPQQIEQAMLGVWQDVPGAVNFGIKE